MSASGPQFCCPRRVRTPSATLESKGLALLVVSHSSLVLRASEAAFATKISGPCPAEAGKSAQPELSEAETLSLWRLLQDSGGLRCDGLQRHGVEHVPATY